MPSCLDCIQNDDIFEGRNIGAFTLRQWEKAPKKVGYKKLLIGRDCPLMFAIQSVYDIIASSVVLQRQETIP